MVFDEVKLPHALHRQVAVRLFLVALGFLLILKSKEVGVASHTVLLINLWVAPFRCMVCHCWRST